MTTTLSTQMRLRACADKANAVFLLDRARELDAAVDAINKRECTAEMIRAVNAAWARANAAYKQSVDPVDVA